MQGIGKNGMQIEITQMSSTLLSVGGIFLLGFAADLAGRYTPLPRVTLLLLCGLLFGPAGRCFFAY